MSDHRRVFSELRRTPGMFVWNVNYDSITGFIEGYDQAFQGGALLGFREWLVVRNDGGNNLAWVGLVLYLAFPGAADPYERMNESPEARDAALNMLFDLLDEFLAIRQDRLDGLRSVFFEHEKWLRRQDWYRPGWPGYLE